MNNNVDDFLNNKEANNEEVKLMEKMNNDIFQLFYNKLFIKKGVEADIYTRSKNMPYDFINNENNHERMVKLTQEESTAKEEYNKYKEMDIVDNVICTNEPYFATITLNKEAEKFLQGSISSAVNEYMTTPSYENTAKTGNFVSKITDGKGKLVDLYYSEKHKGAVFVKEDGKFEACDIETIQNSETEVYKNAAQALQPIINKQQTNTKKYKM